MNWLIHIIVNTLTLIVVAGYLDSFYLEGIGAAILASIVLSILNIIVKPFLILLTLPVTFVTLGLFLFVINAITLMITEGLMGDAFEIESFGTAILAAIIISILSTLIHHFIVRPLQERQS